MDAFFIPPTRMFLQTPSDLGQGKVVASFSIKHHHSSVYTNSSGRGFLYAVLRGVSVPRIIIDTLPRAQSPLHRLVDRSLFLCLSKLQFRRCSYLNPFRPNFMQRASITTIFTEKRLN